MTAAPGRLPGAGRGFQARQQGMDGAPCPPTGKPPRIAYAERQTITKEFNRDGKDARLSPGIEGSSQSLVTIVPHSFRATVSNLLYRGRVTPTNNGPGGCQLTHLARLCA